MNFGNEISEILSKSVSSHYTLYKKYNSLLSMALMKDEFHNQIFYTEIRDCLHSIVM